MATKQIERQIIDGNVIEHDRPAAIMQLGDADSEQDWDEWIDSIKESEGSGTIRAYKLPLGPDGIPNPSMKGSKQVHLGSWPHSQFSFDELVGILKRDYLRPGETAGIRLTGVRAGQTGTPFNRIITLMRPATQDNPSGSGGGMELALILKNQGEMLERVLNRPVAVVEPPAPSKSFAENLRDMVLPFAPIIAPALAAWIGRPKEKSDMGAMLDIMERMQDMREGKENDKDSDPDSFMGIVKAIGPQALGLLNTMAQRMPAQGAAPVRRVSTTVAQVRPAHIPDSAGKSAVNNANGNATVTQPAPNETVSSRSPAIPTLQESEKMLAQLAPQLEQLATMAEQGADPVETAKLVMDSIPESPEFDSQFYDLLSDPVKFGRLAILSPRAKAQWPWFEQVRVALLAEFEAEEEPAPAVG